MLLLTLIIIILRLVLVNEVLII